MAELSNSKYLLRQEHTAIPGTTVRVILEFPEITNEGGALIFHLDDVMTVSYSMYRSKTRVVTLGRSDVIGYGLGTRLVAGSVIRSVFTTDKLTKLQEEVYFLKQAEIQERLTNVNAKIPKGLPNKDMLALMKDDLTSFNIHLAVQTEELTFKEDKQVYEPNVRYEVIMGCVIINTGQVYSIEDLITEGTFSYEAKAVKSIADLSNTTYNFGFSSNSSVVSASNLLDPNYKPAFNNR